MPNNAVLPKLRAMLLRPYYRLRISWPVWWGILNRQARQVYSSNKISRSSVQDRLVDSLQKTGIAHTSLEELFGDPGLLGKLRTYAESLQSQATPRNKKEYLLELFETYPAVDPQNPFVRFSLDRKILDVVNGYLSLCSRLYFLGCDITRVVDAGAPVIRSQRWHRDPEDRRMCKVFIYLSDVDDTAGPFHYVQRSQDGGKWRETFPQRPSYGYYPPDGAVEASIPKEDIVRCTGVAGTVVFCDTSGLHCGGYATGKERLMFTAGYLTAASDWKSRCQHPTPEQLAELATDSVVRYALTHNSYIL